MSKGEEQHTMFEILQNFRKVVNGNSPKATVSSAAAKLNFTDASILEGAGKRKSGNESIATPPKRWRAESESTQGTSSPCVASPWEARRLKASLTEAKLQVAILEKRISHQHSIRQEMELLFEREKESLIEQRKQKELAAEELEQRLKHVRNREIDIKNQLAQTGRHLDELKIEKDREKQILQQEIAELRSKVIGTTSNADKMVLDMKAEVQQLTQALELSHHDVEVLREAYEKATEELSEMGSLKAELETQGASLAEAQLQLQQLQAEKKTYNDWLEEFKASQKRLAGMPALEREVSRLRSEARELRSTVQQKLLLEEQVHCLTTNLAALQPLQQQYKDLQTSFSKVEHELEEWRTVGGRHEVGAPSLLSARLEALHQRDISLTTSKLSADTRISRCENELLTATHEWEKARSKLTDIQNIQKNQQSLIHRLQKKLLLVSRERDSYRQQLDCYEKELTVTLAGEAGGAGSAGLLSARVDGLEKALQGYRDLVAMLEEAQSSSKGEGTPALREQLSRLRDEVEGLKKDNGVLRARKDHLELQLEYRALKGDYDPTKTKIIHLTQNPLSKAQEEAKNDLEKAQEEIVELKQKVKRLERNEMEMTQRLSETIQEVKAPSSAELEVIRGQLETSKLKMQRMTEVFKTSSHEFRQVCYLLTGYKIDRSSNIYRLSNMYADSPDDYLNFQLSDGDIEMLQTDYSGRIEQFVETHLHQQKSIPAFLSSLTLSLFQKTSMLSDTYTS